MNRLAHMIVMIVTILVFVNSESQSLEVSSHRAMNELIAQTILNGFNLDQYLKRQLGMQEGIKTYVANNSINQQIFRWLSDGGEYEDKPNGCLPYWRSRNHFHNPIDNNGFSGWWDSGFASGISAVEWSMQPVNSQGCGYYSWKDARNYYYAALTSSSKAVREGYFAQTFRALGQIMHLVQDMSVPEHVRNNGHYFGDDYEEWAKRISVNSYSARVFSGNGSYPLSIRNLFDTHQFNGTNPDVTIQDVIGLAEYTNANFLSPDSIFTKFDYPSYVTMIPNIVSNKLYLRKVGYGENVELLARATNFYNYLPQEYKKLALTVADPMVYEEYASHLIPRAIGYSSQVLSLFFRGQFDVSMEAGSMTVTNASNEVMTSGWLELYYESESGERNPVPNLSGAEITELRPGSSQAITFDQPPGAASYVLVYKGMLGNEPDAVVGKLVDNIEEFVMFTVYAGAKKSVIVWKPRNNTRVLGPVDFDDVEFQAWYTSRQTTGNSLFSGVTPCGLPPGPEGTRLSGCQQLIPGQTDEVTYSIVGGETGDDEYGPTEDRYDNLNEVNHALTYIYNNYPFGLNYLRAPMSYYVDVFLPGSPIMYTGFRTEGTYTKTRHRFRQAHDTIGGTTLVKNETWEFYGPLGKMGEYVANQEFVGDYLQINCTESENYIPGWAAFGYYPERFPGTNVIWGREWYAGSIGGRYTAETIADVCLVAYTGMSEHQTISEGHIVEWTFTPEDAGTILVQAQALYYPDGSFGKNFIAAGRNHELEASIHQAIIMAYSLNGGPRNQFSGLGVGISILK